MWDVDRFVLTLPTLEYQDRLWTWKDLAVQVKTGVWVYVCLYVCVCVCVYVCVCVCACMCVLVRVCVFVSVDDRSSAVFARPFPTPGANAPIEKLCFFLALSSQARARTRVSHVRAHHTYADFHTKHTHTHTKHTHTIPIQTA